MDYRGLGLYRKMGYIPCDLEEESVSKTLEYDYNRLGRRPRSCQGRRTHRLRQAPREQPATTAISGTSPPASSAPVLKTANGPSPSTPSTWVTGISGATTPSPTPGKPPSASSTTSPATSNSSAATKPSSRNSTISLAAPQPCPKTPRPDIAGLIGQYAHGNEPSHHIAYLYAFAGQPWKTQQRIHQIVTTLYSNNLDGMAGNEDVGQMSAWYMLSAIGFYSVDPVSTKYILGTPLFEKVTLSLADGKKLIVEAKRQTPDSIYINSVEFEGEPHPKSWFEHADIAQGGHFIYHLQPKANEEFGSAKEDRPKSELSVPAKA